MNAERTSALAFRLAAFLGASGIILGALGAHALADRLAEAGMTRIWETAVLYHLTHALALLGAALLARQANNGNRWCSISIIAWTAGIPAFSGSLYILALGGKGAIFGPVTPLGGIALIIGWLAVAGWVRATTR